MTKKSEQQSHMDLGDVAGQELTPDEHRARHIYLDCILRHALAEMPGHLAATTTTALHLMSWSAGTNQRARHRHLDELAADMMAVTGRCLSNISLADLTAWSERQTVEPEEAFMPDLTIRDVTVIACNEQWTFAVGRMGDRWVGFARAECFLNLMTEVSEGYLMGLPLDQHEKCVKMTSAVLIDEESDYGPVEHWWLPPEQRGNPDDFRCSLCQAIGCNGRDCLDYFDMDEENPKHV